MHTFGMSAPMKVVAEHFGFTVDRVVDCCQAGDGASAERPRRYEENDNATWHDRPRPHGRQHGRAPDEGRPSAAWSTTATPTPCSSRWRKGAKGTTSLPDFVKALTKPRAVWLMLPAAAVDSVLHSLVPLLEPDDIVIEGGNSYYHDDIRRAGELKAKGLHYVDVGVSGGVWGLERGYCHMIGGEDAIVKHLDPIFRSLAPGVEAAPRTPGATGEPTPGRIRLPALRPEWRRPFREDGPQRHRIRHDGGLRRRLQHHQECQYRPASSTRWTRRRRRCASPIITSTRSTWRRSPNCGAAAAWSARGCST